MLGEAGHMTNVREIVRVAWSEELGVIKMDGKLRKYSTKIVVKDGMDGTIGGYPVNTVVKDVGNYELSTGNIWGNALGSEEAEIFNDMKQKIGTGQVTISALEF